MHKNIKTVAGCFTNVTCNVSATDGREVELTAYIAIGQERRPVLKSGANIFAFPAVEYGQHLYEIRADGKPLIFGFLLVRPSAFPVEEGAVDYTLNATLDSVEALHVDIELTPGPRGYSAYDIAVMEGFEGSEAEWLEHMRQLTATLAVERVTPLMERAETAADKSESAASAAKTERESAAAHAAAAKESELAAAKHKTAAADEVEKAKLERETAATHATAAAQSAQAAMANQQAAAQAQVAAETAKADADAAKLAAQTSERNAKASADDTAADKTAAEQAKKDALVAQTKAEQEAQKAADNAALLGDAALKSADNSFTGTNTFNGDILGTGNIFGIPLNEMIGADFFCYQFFTKQEEILAFNPEVWKQKAFACKLGKYKAGYIDQKTTIDGSHWNTYQSLYEFLFIWNQGVKEHNCTYTFNKNVMKKFVLIDESAPGIGRPVINGAKETIYILPALTYFDSAFTWMGYPKLTVFAPLVQSFDYSKAVYSSGCKDLTWISCNATALMFRGMALTRVGCGFPKATTIQMPSATLDKESVMKVLAALLPYNADTMTAVPELTMGIDPALDGDAEINEALLNAQAAVEDGGKGWNVAVNGFTITAAPEAATLGLRKLIYAQRRADELGEYVDAAGDRWTVRYGDIVLENWVANEQLGYEAFPSLDDALEFWGLVEYRDPEPPADAAKDATEWL